MLQQLTPLREHRELRMRASEPGSVPEDQQAEEWARLDALLTAVGSQDRSAFASLYQTVASQLLGIAVRIVGRRDLAEEVLQEAFISIWQKAGQYRAGTGSPMGWLVTVVRHRAIDRLRAMGSRREFGVGGDAELAPLSTDPVDWNERSTVGAEAVNRCLERLKDRQRRLILLAFYHGYTHEELAANLGVPLGTIKSDVRRGLAGLRACLEQ